MRIEKKDNPQGGFDLKIWRLNQAAVLQNPRSASVGFLFLIAIFSLALISNASLVIADSESLVSGEMKDMPFGERKTLAGKVSAANKEGLAIITKVDAANASEKEIWLPFAEGIRLNGYNDVSEVLSNDDVVAIYEEGGGSTRRLRELTFVQRPPQEPEAIEVEVPAEEVPQEPGTEEVLL